MEDVPAARTLFDLSPELPRGFVYRPELITREEEAALVEAIGRLEFSEVRMHGVTARRRIVQYGWRYAFGARALSEGAPLPDFLSPLRDRAAELAGVEPAGFSEALVTEYQPGATIGWHRDAPPFGIVAGVSLLAACTFRFRLGPGREQPKAAQVLEPRSAYVLRGDARSKWQHSIPPSRSLRYSVTFRTLTREVRRGNR